MRLKKPYHAIFNRLHLLDEHQVTANEEGLKQLVDAILNKGPQDFRAFCVEEGYSEETVTRLISAQGQFAKRIRALVKQLGVEQ